MVNPYRKMKEFSDGSALFYGPGSFDDWCVYYTNSGDIRDKKALKDIHYFSYMKELAKVYGAEFVWEKFGQMYNAMADSHNNFTEKFSSQITDMSRQFVYDPVSADKLFTTLYLTMLAEENKANTILGKSIKALGVHQIIIENEPVYYAANFSRGKRWFVLRDECLMRNITRNRIGEIA